MTNISKLAEAVHREGVLDLVDWSGFDRDGHTLYGAPDYVRKKLREIHPNSRVRLCLSRQHGIKQSCGT